MPTYGPSGKVVNFIFGLLAVATQARYRAGLQRLSDVVEELGINDVYALNEEQQDFLLCDLLIVFIDRIRFLFLSCDQLMLFMDRIRFYSCCVTSLWFLSIGSDVVLVL